MRNALRENLHPDYNNETSKFLLYRNTFDEFFGHIDELVLQEERGLISQEDVLAIIGYYMRQMKYPHSSYGEPDTFSEFGEAFYPRVWRWIGQQWPERGIKTKERHPAGLGKPDAPARDTDTLDAPPSASGPDFVGRNS
jgi:hypothetical protein